MSMECDTRLAMMSLNNQTAHTGAPRRARRGRKLRNISAASVASLAGLALTIFTRGA